MLGICDDFAEESAIVYNARKSTCFWMKHSFANKVTPDIKPQFVIGGSVIEFVDSWLHLGHFIASSNDDNLDILNRRIHYVDRLMTSYAISVAQDLLQN